MGKQTWGRTKRPPEQRAEQAWHAWSLATSTPGADGPESCLGWLRWGAGEQTQPTLDEVQNSQRGGQGWGTSCLTIRAKSRTGVRSGAQKWGSQFLTEQATEARSGSKCRSPLEPGQDAEGTKRWPVVTSCKAGAGVATGRCQGSPPAAGA